MEVKAFAYKMKKKIIMTNLLEKFPFFNKYPPSTFKVLGGYSNDGEMRS